MEKDRKQSGSSVATDDIAYLNRVFRQCSMFVSTVRLSCTHGSGIFMFHEVKEMPFIGIAIGVRGLSICEGGLLGDGPHWFNVAESVVNEDGDKRWGIKSEDSSFRVVAREIVVQRDEDE